MNRLIAIVISILIPLMTAAGLCTVTDVDAAEPFIYEETSLDAVNKSTGLNLHTPGVMGVTDVDCCILTDDGKTIAELTFAVNGRKYILRGSPDLSYGIVDEYTDDGMDAVFLEEDNVDYYTLVNEEYMVAHWTNESGQYALVTAVGDDLDAETFASIADEFIDITNP